MRRGILFVFAVALAAAATVARAQVAAEATLRTPAETITLTIVEDGGKPYFPVDDVMTALGGEVTVDQSGGTHVKLGEFEGVLGPESRYAVVGEDLIEMPTEPIRIENRLFVPWQFFRGFLRRVELDASWDAATRTLAIEPLKREAIHTDVSVVDVGGLTKVVVQLSSRTEFTVSRKDASYLIRFRNPLVAPFEQQSYNDPFVTAIDFTGSQIEIRLRTPEVVASSYRLDNPFRVVLDLKRGEAPSPARPDEAQTPRRPVQPVEAPGVHTVVLDPGHGGRETGAMGPGGLLEKDLTLEICRRLRRSLIANVGVKVILTRDDDSVVPLDERTAIANQYHADLFLSVHLNSAPYKTVSGSETYFLSVEASDERAQMAADRENASPSGVEPPKHSDLDMILWDLAQQDYLKESSRFAELIQDEMARATGVEKRGVKQAPFRVLVGATMPAALVEVGFISNPEEEKKLTQPEYQELIVQALTSAIARYKSEYDTRVGVLSPRPSTGVESGARSDSTSEPASPTRRR